MSSTRNGSSATFMPSPPLTASTTRRPTGSKSTRRTPTSRITPVSDRQLTDLLSTTNHSSIVVLKCFASYCRGCKGVEPKYRKIAAAYEDADQPQQGRPSVRFCEMDYARNEQFCKDTLGVRSLPFFGIWKDGRYIGGEAIGWQNVGRRLVEKIETVVASPSPEPTPSRP